MIKTLTNQQPQSPRGSTLTNKNTSRFILGFNYSLIKDYTFNEMTVRDNRKFQKFLDLVSKLSVREVDEKYSRVPDFTDVYNGLQVRHYEVSDKFRIHVILENGVYYIIRLDPNHKFHN